MKKILSFAAMLLALTCAFTCEKEEDDMNNTVGVKGIINGYHKCTDFENGGIVFGVYIVAHEKGTLLAYNIPHETICSLLEVTSLEDFEQGGLYFNREIPPITFDYREAEQHEIVTISCVQFALWAAYPEQYAKQVIITKINGKAIK
jgi:hypothetical protein